ncbi:MAG: hypothetical protein QXO60_00050 [Candidatus Micrarchaeia archaeon]
MSIIESRKLYYTILTKFKNLVYEPIPSSNEKKYIMYSFILVKCLSVLNDKKYITRKGIEHLLSQSEEFAKVINTTERNRKRYFEKMKNNIFIREFIGISEEKQHNFPSKRLWFPKFTQGNIKTFAFGKVNKELIEDDKRSVIEALSKLDPDYPNTLSQLKPDEPIENFHPEFLIWLFKSIKIGWGIIKEDDYIHISQEEKEKAEHELEMTKKWIRFLEKGETFDSQQEELKQLERYVEWLTKEMPNRNNKPYKYKLIKPK